MNVLRTIDQEGELKEHTCGGEFFTARVLELNECLNP